MARKRLYFLLPLSVLIFAQFVRTQTMPLSGAGFTGKVSSLDGTPLEGVAVSARASDKTFTTTVYTNQNGEYIFPPLENGRYQMWAQAATFDAGRAQLKVASGANLRQNFVLKSQEHFEKQLSGAEWLASLPAETPRDQRAKIVFRHYCADCHISSFPLQNRFDAAGWAVIFDMMSKINVCAFGQEEYHPAIQEHKDELVPYLERVRGPFSPPLKFKPLPRPTGESAQVIVTEFDVSPGDRPGYLSSHDGSDWSEGTPSTHEGRSIHDLTVDKRGSVWFANTIPLGRTIGRLDPETGRVTDFALRGKDGMVVFTGGIITDGEGNVWFLDRRKNISPEAGYGMVKFNPKTEKFQSIPWPGPVRIGDFPVFDSKGNVWFDSPDGAAKWNAATGKYDRYLTETKTGEKPYECVVDAKDNVWCTMMGSNRIITIDSHTSHVGVVTVAPLEEGTNGQNRSNRGHVADPSTDALLSQGPRRPDADRKSNNVWVPLFWTSKLAKIDIDSNKITEYPLPNRDSEPYKAVVDKNHMVWMSLMNSDRIAKFNPFTEQFTEYPLPTLGSEARDITVDNSTNPPTVWVPYYRVNKIARVQFRDPLADPGK